LLDENGDLKIADFGTAREIDIEMTNVVGSAYYMAPEVHKNKSYD
jgi:serine/threonine protein kinase